MYADDLKLFWNVADIGDCDRLLTNLNRVEEWCKLNKLPLNPDKCSVMTYTLKTDPIIVDYTISNTVLKRPNTLVDLGVTFDLQLSFVSHIDNVIEAAYRSYGFIVRCSGEFKESSTLKNLYYAFVRSKLEYASAVWRPHYQVHVDRLEKVQRSFLKFLSFKSDGLYPAVGTPHHELLRKHSFTELNNRRDYYSFIFLYKLVNNQISCVALLEKLNFYICRPNSRISNTFYLPTPRTNVLKFAPLHMMCTICNSVSSTLDIFHSASGQIRTKFLESG